LLTYAGTIQGGKVCKRWERIKVLGRRGGREGGRKERERKEGGPSFRYERGRERRGREREGEGRHRERTRGHNIWVMRRKDVDNAREKEQTFTIYPSSAHVVVRERHVNVLLEKTKLPENLCREVEGELYAAAQQR
jgi:hypothetical protein